MTSDRLTMLFVTNQMNVGGIETNIVRLGREFIDRGHRVIAITGGGTLEPDLADVGVRHVWAPLMGPSPWQLVTAARTLARIVAEENVDVIHNFSAPAAAAAWLALRWRRLLPGRAPPAVVSSAMGLGDPGELRAKERLRVYVTSLGSSSILVMSPKILEAYRYLPVRHRRIVQQKVVGVDEPELHDRRVARAAIRGELGLSPSTRIVLTAGALHPRKNHELFVGAVPHVKADDVVFLIAGSGPLREQIQADIDAAGLDNRVRLIGERADLDRVMVASDLYLRPGFVEGGIGTTVLHAQALGVPVIAWDSFDVREAIQHDVTGILVPPFDLPALARAFDELLGDPERAAGLGRKGKETFAAVHGIQAVADGLEREYRRAIEATRPRSN